MKIHSIQVAFDKLPQSIKNTAAEYVEGRNVLIYCLIRNARRTEAEVIQWLKENEILIKDLNEYRLEND